MNGPEHYREAERLLAQAEGEFLDNSNDPAPRDQYATDAEWASAVQFANEVHERSLTTASWMSAQAQVHATLALAAATALIDEKPRGGSFDAYREWEAAAGTPQPGYDVRDSFA